MKFRTLREALEALQEYDFMAGPGAGGGDSPTRPDTSGVRFKGAQHNFVPIDDRDESWPYDDYDGVAGQGPANAYDTLGQQAAGRGGGRDRPNMSGQNTPSSTYDKTWNQDEGADYDEEQRHGDDKYRNVWNDTPDGKMMKKMKNEAGFASKKNLAKAVRREKSGHHGDEPGDPTVGVHRESMGTPFQTGPVASMDGPALQAGRGYSSGSELDPFPSDEKRGPAGQWGGPETIPGQSRGWASSPAMGHKRGVWDVPEGTDMKLREFFDPSPEFFDPSPVAAEAVDNPDQDHLEDQGDEDLEGQLDRMSPEEDGEDGGFTGRLEPQDIFVLPKMGQGGEFVADPTSFGAARGTYGIHTDAKSHDLVDKSSAWDLLQQVVQAMSSHEEKEEEMGEQY